MTVTAMQRLSKTKTRVTIDETDTLVLSLRDVAIYDLREGEEIPESTWEELMAELRARAMKKCGTLLQDMDYSVKGLTDKLKKAGFPKEIIDESIEKLKKAHYLDDARFARTYFRSHIENRSLLRVKMDLMAKGISPELIEEAAAAYEEENCASDRETEQVVRLLERKHYDPELPYEERQKILASIARKGYRMDTIKEAMAKLEETESDS